MKRMFGFSAAVAKKVAESVTSDASRPSRTGKRRRLSMGFFDMIEGLRTAVLRGQHHYFSWNRLEE
jgi:hypothetical protein